MLGNRKQYEPRACHGACMCRCSSVVPSSSHVTARTAPVDVLSQSLSGSVDASSQRRGPPDITQIMPQCGRRAQSPWPPLFVRFAHRIISRYVIGPHFNQCALRCAWGCQRRFVEFCATRLKRSPSLRAVRSMTHGVAITASSTSSPCAATRRGLRRRMLQDIPVIIF